MICLIACLSFCEGAFYFPERDDNKKYKKGECVVGIKTFVEKVLKAGIGSELNEEVYFTGREHPLSVLEEVFLGAKAEVYPVGETLKVISGDKSMEINIAEVSSSSIFVKVKVFNVAMAFA